MSRKQAQYTSDAELTPYDLIAALSFDPDYYNNEHNKRVKRRQFGRQSKRQDTDNLIDDVNNMTPSKVTSTDEERLTSTAVAAAMVREGILRTNNAVSSAWNLTRDSFTSPPSSKESSSFRWNLSLPQTSPIDFSSAKINLYQGEWKRKTVEATNQLATAIDVDKVVENARWAGNGISKGLGSGISKGWSSFRDFSGRAIPTGGKKGEGDAGAGIGRRSF